MCSIPGSTLAFRIPPGDYPQLRGQAQLPETGGSVEVLATERRNDPLRQVLTETCRLIDRRADGSVVREDVEELALRWTYRFELHHLLELAGLDLLAEYSDFAKSPPADGRELGSSRAATAIDQA